MNHAKLKAHIQKLKSDAFWSEQRAIAAERKASEKQANIDRIAMAKITRIPDDRNLANVCIRVDLATVRDFEATWNVIESELRKALKQAMTRGF